MKTTEPVSLHAIGRCLHEAYPQIRQAMAMDGGSSSDVSISPALQKAVEKTAGTHSWMALLNSGPTGHIGLPAVIGISPRGPRHVREQPVKERGPQRANGVLVGPKVPLAAHRKAGLDPGIHTAADIVNVGIAEIRQRFSRNVAPMAGLAVDHDVLIQGDADFPVARFDFAEIDVQIGAGNETRCMFFGRTDVDEHKTLLRHRRRFVEASTQLLDGQEI